MDAKMKNKQTNQPCNYPDCMNSKMIAKNFTACNSSFSVHISKEIDVIADREHSLNFPSRNQLGSRPFS
jgi:hypothetical protein